MENVINIASPVLFLKEWREAAGLTLREVEALTGLSNNSISNKERGERQVKPRELQLFAKAYGCEPAALLGPPPSKERAEYAARAKIILETLTAVKIEVWLAMGESMQKI